MTGRSCVSCLATLAVLAFSLHATAAKKTTVPPVPLRVAVAPVDSANSVCRVQPDGRGEYVDGVDGVEARINEYGQLWIDFSPARTVAYDFSAPTPTATGPVPALLVPPGDSHTGTRSETVPLQSMAVATYQCTQGGFTFHDSGKFWVVGFRRPAYVGDDVTGTSFVRVTRTGADTWEVEPRGDCLAGSSTAFGRLNSVVDGPGRSVWTASGNYYFPYKLLLVRK